MNCLNFTYNRPLLMLLILLLILGFGVEFPQLYIYDSYPNCQFVGLTYTGRYCFHVLLRSERDQPQNCLYSALAELKNWFKASKHIKLNHMCHIHSFIGMCRMRQFFAIVRSFFHSSLLCTLSLPPVSQLVFHPSLLCLAFYFLVCQIHT